MILYRPRWRLGYPALSVLVGVLLAAAAPAAESFEKSDAYFKALGQADYLISNERAASTVERVARQLQLKPGENKFELWITGTASPLFKKEAEFSDILVEDRIVTSLPVLD
jgi:hypothetical protein